MKLKEYLDVFKKIPLFNHFSEEDILALFKKNYYKMLSYKKESLIFMEGQECDTLNVILEGNLRIQKTDSLGKSLVIAEFKTGEIVGETLIFGQPNYYPMSGFSTVDTTMLYIPKDAVLYLCQHDDKFLVEFLKLISGKSITLSSKLDQISLTTIRQKICEFIILEYKKNNSMKIPLGMTKKEWADRMGVQRPSLSRELSKMKAENLIDYNHNDIYISNLEKICAIGDV